MDISLISQPLPLSNLLPRQSQTLTISSAAIFDAIAPPPVKPTKFKTTRRTILRKKRRTRRRSDGGDEECVGGDNGDDGYYGGGNWGGGRGWNYGGQNWNEESSEFVDYSFALKIVYEVVYWIALSNCVHFTFKKFVRFFTQREKVGMRLSTVC